METALSHCSPSSHGWHTKTATMTDPLTDPSNWAPAMPLFEDNAVCDCPPDRLHVCRPPWVDEEGWPE